MKAFQLPGNTDLTKKTKNLTKQVIEKYGLQQEAVKYELEKRALI